jgi:hypothetical protein
MHNQLARQLVDSYQRQETQRLVEIADIASRDNSIRDSIISGLLTIAKAEDQFEDMQTRDNAVTVVRLLGLAKFARVHDELFELLVSAFRKEKLSELASIENCCGDSELRFLGNVVRAVLCIPEKRSRAAVEQVAQIFSGTKLGRKITEWLGE